MRKKIWISILVLVITIAGVYFFVKFNPPLEIGTLGLSGDNKSALIGIGNKGFQKIRILNVSVNNNEKPSDTKIQIDNASQGFIVTDDFTNESSKKYKFVDINEAVIKTGTSPSSTYEYSDDGTDSDINEIYGISVLHKEAINQVHIMYSYFGISFNETVIFN